MLSVIRAPEPAPSLLSRHKRGGGGEGDPPSVSPSPFPSSQPEKQCVENHYKDTNMQFPCVLCLGPRHPRGPVDSKDRQNIENDISSHEPYVPPRRHYIHRQPQAAHDLIGLGDGAVQAVGRSVWILYVSSGKLYVRPQIGAAGSRRERRRVDVQYLDIRTRDLRVRQAREYHAVDEVSQRGDPVDEDPEAREVVGGDEDTVGWEKVSALRSQASFVKG